MLLMCDTAVVVIVSAVANVVDVVTAVVVIVSAVANVVAAIFGFEDVHDSQLKKKHS